MAQLAFFIPRLQLLHLAEESFHLLRPLGGLCQVGAQHRVVHPTAQLHAAGLGFRQAAFCDPAAWEVIGIAA